jgi:hypothetical protein
LQKFEEVVGSSGDTPIELRDTRRFGGK